MQQEFEPKLSRDILKTSRNKSFDVRARFGAIYSASKTEKYRSHRVKIEKVMTENLSQVNALVLITEPP